MTQIHTHTIVSPADRMDPMEVADLLGVRVGTLALWRCSGRHELPYSKVGRKIFYSRSVVMEWLSCRTATSTAAIRSQLQTA